MASTLFLHFLEISCGLFIAVFPAVPVKLGPVKLSRGSQAEDLGADGKIKEHARLDTDQGKGRTKDTMGMRMILNVAVKCINLKPLQVHVIFKRSKFARENKNFWQ